MGAGFLGTSGARPRGWWIVLACGLLAWCLLGARPAAAAPACTGLPHSDAFIEGCGLLIDGWQVLTWDRPATNLSEAFSPASMVFIGLPRQGETSPALAVSVWHRDPSSLWRAWGAGVSRFTPAIQQLEPGGVYFLVSNTPVAWSLPPIPAAPPTPPASVFSGRQVVAYYGFPGVPQMGILGEYDAKTVMRLVTERAAVYDALNGEQTVIPALHLITAVAQADPGFDGTYLGRLSTETVMAYADIADAAGGLLIIDIQIGWSDPLAEVRLYEDALRRPNVHVALDPEFATWRKGEPPGGAIGSVTGDEVNAVQRYLGDLVREAGLPSKALIIHQFRDDMILQPERIAAHAGVDLVIDMDGWGGPAVKLAGYERYALAPYASYAGFKLFYRWDTPLIDPATIQALPYPPHLIIYQ